MTTTSKSSWLFTLAIVCVFIGTLVPAEAGRRSTDDGPPPPVVVDPDIALVSAQ